MDYLNEVNKCVFSLLWGAFGFGVHRCLRILLLLQFLLLSLSNSMGTTLQYPLGLAFWEVGHVVVLRSDAY